MGKIPLHHILPAREGPSAIYSRASVLFWLLHYLTQFDELNAYGLCLSNPGGSTSSKGDRCCIYGKAGVLWLVSVTEIETALYQHELLGIGGKRGRYAPGSKQYHLYPQLILG
jgi:hypothetical protein